MMEYLSRQSRSPYNRSQREREREIHELLNIRGVTFWLFLTRDNKIHARYLRREQAGRSSGKVFNHACLLSFIADKQEHRINSERGDEWRTLRIHRRFSLGSLMILAFHRDPDTLVIPCSIDSFPRLSPRKKTQRRTIKFNNKRRSDFIFFNSIIASKHEYFNIPTSNFTAGFHRLLTRYRERICCYIRDKQNV